MPTKHSSPSESATFETSSSPEFVAYYARESRSGETRRRFEAIRDKLLKLMGTSRTDTNALAVLDVGCGAGTQCRLWAELGHKVFGIDVNEALIALARTRTAEFAHRIQFDVGTATSLPYADKCMDVCLLPELLEHVEDWRTCLAEACRVLQPGGLLYLSTTNVLCPIQEEFDLPLYSWYPSFVKRRYERLAVTTRPELVNHARYPALHWFTYFELEQYLSSRGMLCRDRFDTIDGSQLSSMQRFAVDLVKRFSLIRYAAHVLTPWTTLFAVKS